MSGRIEVTVVRLDDGYPLVDGMRVEGWAFGMTEAKPYPGPMTVSEARRLLGPEAVAICFKRGMNSRRSSGTPGSRKGSSR